MKLLRYTVSRLFAMAFSLLIIITIVFVATRFAQMKHWSFPFSFSEQVMIIKDEYIFFIRNLLTSWNWGSSSGEPVWETLKEKAPLTLKLNFIAFLIYFPIGITIGVFRALKKDSLFDRMLGAPLLVFGSIPSFIWIFVFILFFGYTMNWLPPQPPIAEDPLYWRLAGWVMPVGALALSPLAKYAILMRNELTENFYQDYLLLLRTKGLSKGQVFRKHLIRDSFVPIMPEIIPTFVFVMIGSFFVEMIYNLKGVATLLFDSMFHPMIDFYFISIDTPMVVMICAFYAFITLFFSFIVDVAYAIIDPRIRVGIKR